MKTITKLTEHDILFSQLFINEYHENVKLNEHKKHFYNILAFFEKQIKESKIDDFNIYFEYWKIIEYKYDDSDKIIFSDKIHMRNRIYELAKVDGFKNFVQLAIENSLKLKEENQEDYFNIVFNSGMHFLFYYIKFIEDEAFKIKFYETFINKYHESYDYIEKLYTTEKEVDILFDTYIRVAKESPSAEKRLNDIFRKLILDLIHKRIGFLKEEKEDDQNPWFYIESILKFIPDNYIKLNYNQFSNLCVLYTELDKEHNYIKELLRVVDFNNMIKKQNKDGFIVSEKFQNDFVIYQLEQAASDILNIPVLFNKDVKYYNTLDFNLDSQYFIYENYKYLGANKRTGHFINYIISNNFFERDGNFININDDHREMILMNIKT